MIVEVESENARKNPIIQLDIPMDSKLEGSVEVRLSGVEKVIGSGQVVKRLLNNNGASKSKQLSFTIDEIPAKKSMKLEIRSGGSTDNDLQWTEDKNSDQLKLGGKLALEFMREPLDKSSKKRIGETYKVFHHVYDFEGKKTLTKGPGGLFPHHRGLFYGFNRIKYGKNQNADVWHCSKGESQAFVKTIGISNGDFLASHVAQIDWKGRDEKVFASESREMMVYQFQDGKMIEFASRLESKVGKVILDGDPQHAGFQFRASQHVPDKTKSQTYYVRPDGKGEPGKFRNWPGNKEHVNLPWNALSFVIDDQRYTCCYLDRPENPKESRFSERDYGRFGSYFKFELDTDKPLELNYRIWIQKGEMTVDQIDKLSKDFVSPIKAKVVQ